MRRWMVVWILSLPLCADGEIAGDVRHIIAKMEALQRVKIPSVIDFELYDPFRKTAPLVQKSQGVKRKQKSSRVFRLMAVMNDRALIDGHWVRKGERIGGYRLAALSSSGVWLVKRGIRRFLPLGQRGRRLRIKDRNR